MNERLESTIETLKSWEEVNRKGDLTFDDLMYRSLRDTDYSLSTQETFETVDFSLGRYIYCLKNLGDVIEQGDEDAIAQEISICLLLTIKEMCSRYSGLPPFDALWAKYVSNHNRFYDLKKFLENQDTVEPDVWNKVRKQSKERAENDCFGDLASLEFFRAREEFGFPAPIGEDSLRLFQLVEEELFLSVNNPFSFKDMYYSMLLEVEELKKAYLKVRTAQAPNSGVHRYEAQGYMEEYSFELADIFHYLMFMMIIKGDDMADTMTRASNVGYREALGIGHLRAGFNTMLWNKRFKVWLENSKKLVWNGGF